MKQIIFVILGIISGYFCFAQDKSSALSDSLAYESRAKADKVLSYFSMISGKRILYSIGDEEYYIIIQQGENHYREWVLITDKDSIIVTVKELDKEKEIDKLQSKRCLSRKNRRLLARMKENRLTIINAFDEKQYHTGFITSSPQASFIAGERSYFVMKDGNERYGEYCLNILTIPPPINRALYFYLVQSLTSQLHVL